MNQLPANTGWLWVKQSYAYFKQQPLEFATLFLGYFFFTHVMEFIPYLGQVVAFVFSRLFTLSCMQACKVSDNGVRVQPTLLLFGFRSPQVAKLVQLGLLEVIVVLVTLGAASLVDNGLLWQIITGQKTLELTAAESTRLMGSMLFAMLLYLPAAMAFWFAVPLVGWQNMSVFKAIFYSFFAVVRARRAFLAYLFVLVVLSVLLSVLASIINVASIARMLSQIVLTVILYCSFYPIYKSIFGDGTEISIIS